MEHILVGIDDSPNAREALRWALDHAGPDDEIQAMYVWHMPPVGGIDGLMLEPEPFAQGAHQEARAVVDDVLSDRPGFADRVVTRVVSGHASGTLIEAGKDTDLLVVGARGRGGFVGMILGSVASSVVNHAPCPVVVVPAPDEA